MWPRCRTSCPGRLRMRSSFGGFHHRSRLGSRASPSRRSGRARRPGPPSRACGPSAYARVAALGGPARSAYAPVACLEACRSGKVLQARAKDDFQAPLKQPLLLRVAVRAGDFALQAASRYRSELNDTTSTLCGNLWTEQSVSVRSHVCWRFRHAINRMELNYLVETLSHAYSACQDASGCGRGRLVRFLRPDFQPLKELGAASLAFSVRARTLAAIYIFIKAIEASHRCQAKFLHCGATEARRASSSAQRPPAQQFQSKVLARLTLRVRRRHAL